MKRTLIAILALILSVFAISVVEIQSHVIQQQRHLIHQMAENPACMQAPAPVKLSDN